MFGEEENFTSSMSYVEGIRSAKDVNEAANSFSQLIRELNFMGFAYASNIDPGQIGSRDEISHLAMPEAWLANYMQKGYMLSDPVLKWCMDRNPPSTWENIRLTGGADQHPIWEDAKSFGLVDGMTFSFQLDDKIGFLSMASHVPIKRHVFAIASGVAKYAIVAFHFLRRGDEVVRAQGDPRVSADDLKMLYLVNQGFSDADIADVMGTTRATINKHLNRLRKATHTTKRQGPAQILSWCGAF